jgi:hypothetical protein
MVSINYGKCNPDTIRQYISCLDIMWNNKAPARSRELAHQFLQVCAERRKVSESSSS